MSRPSLVGVAITWGLMAALLGAIAVTYTRTDPAELYHVSHGGLAGGAGRALVATNFPVALVALAVLPIVTARLLAGGPSRRGRTAIVISGIVSAGLCAVTAWPGVVTQSDLDAKPINAAPALGVALALGLSVAAARVPGPRGKTAERGRALRFAALAVVAFVSLPWIFAIFGFFVDDVPGLGAIFLSEEIKAGGTSPVVHVGDHHGFDAALMAASALLLMPGAMQIGGRALRHAGLAVVSLLFVYGVANLVEDAWGEQIVSRGWTDWKILQMVRPEVTPAWGLILLGTALVYVLLYGAWRGPIHGQGGRERRITPSRLGRQH